MPYSRVPLRACLWSCLSLMAACTVDNPNLQLPAPDSSRFAEEVYPVLLRDCGFPACHGTPDRFFHVFGPGRTRLSPLTEPYAPATQAELQSTYERARSMLVGEDSPLESLLLRKPLDVAAGGAGHKGDDEWGQAVYGAVTDPNYQLLRAWALTVAASGGTP